MENTKYIVIQGKRIAVSAEIRKAWDQTKDHMLYLAKKEGTCVCPGPALCPGDCGYCKFKKEGRTVSGDSPRHQLEVDERTAAASCQSESLESTPEKAMEHQDKLARIYAYARTICDHGDVIFQLYYESHSTREIAKAIGIPQKTVNRRIQKIRLSLQPFYDKHFRD